MTESRCASGAWAVDAPLYLASKQIVSDIVGFDFHRGVLALGHRVRQCHITEAWPGISDIKRLLVCPEINDVEEVTIPMALETDSLNVGVAAGIFMYHYRPR